MAADPIAITRPAPFAAEADNFSIAELAASFAITPRAIRFYEDQGLISPKRAGQARIYSKRDRARLAWILRGKNVGFSLAEIREMLDLYDVGDGRVRQRRLTARKCRQRISALRAQRADVDTTIAELESFVAMVEGMIPAAPPGV